MKTTPSPPAAILFNFSCSATHHRGVMADCVESSLPSALFHKRNVWSKQTVATLSPDPQTATPYTVDLLPLSQIGLGANGGSFGQSGLLRHRVPAKYNETLINASMRSMH